MSHNINPNKDIIFKLPHIDGPLNDRRIVYEELNLNTFYRQLCDRMGDIEELGYRAKTLIINSALYKILFARVSLKKLREFGGFCIYSDPLYTDEHLVVSKRELMFFTATIYESEILDIGAFVMC